MATNVEATSKMRRRIINAMVRFLVKGPLRLLDSGGDTIAGLGEDGDGGDGDVVAGEACEGAGDEFGDANANADAGLSERLPSSSGTCSGVAGMPCPLFIDVEVCGED